MFTIIVCLSVTQVLCWVSSRESLGIFDRSQLLLFPHFLQNKKFNCFHQVYMRLSKPPHEVKGRVLTSVSLIKLVLIEQSAPTLLMNRFNNRTIYNIKIYTSHLWVRQSVNFGQFSWPRLRTTTMIQNCLSVFKRTVKCYKLLSYKK